MDSSVGGKTAIDTAAGKNLVGAFHQPVFVMADLDVLATLPRREMAAGYAEVLKYGLLGDEPFFAWLEANGEAVLAREPGPLAEAVARCVAMKAAIVEEDEHETGRRALLNLGHTFAHALESETGFGQALLHGEAVGVGCALAFRFSAELGLCSARAAARAEAAIAGAGLPTRLHAVAGAPFSAQRLAAHMAQDKKADASGLGVRPGPRRRGGARRTRRGTAGAPRLPRRRRGACSSKRCGLTPSCPANSACLRRALPSGRSRPVRRS